MILLEKYDTAFNLPPFSEIKDDDFLPAFEQALKLARAGLDAVAEDPSEPTFENLVMAAERAEAPLNQVARCFYVLASADSTPARIAIQKELAPKLAAFTSEIIAHPLLFQRIDALWQKRDTLSDQEARVIDLWRDDFLRSGAALTGENASRMKDINARFAELTTAFSQNLLAEEAGWHLPLKEEDLAGLPDFVIQAARSAGTDNGLDGPALTLSRSLIAPFLMFSPRRDLREQGYSAWTARGANGNDQDNRSIAAETLKLRHEKAQLLGYENFAAYKLEPEMAKTASAVETLLDRVWDPAKQRADADAKILEAMMADDGVNGPLQPWDWRYYAEKRRQVEFDLDEAEVKPYFQLDNMIAAAFDCASQLFGLTIQRANVDVYHPDVMAWEVSKDGNTIALFIGDFFARPSKRSGAWCTTFQSQSRRPEVNLPLVLNVCNFAKPAEGSPALLSFDDARTLFHEFGHALHQMLSDVEFSRISGTSVARDFVELPSQLFEHWLEVPEVLEKFALHAETGAPMPKALLDKVLAASTFDMGFSTVEYLASAYVDLAFHNGPPPSDVMAAQDDVLKKIGMPSAIRMRHATPHFAHVFSGDGYSSGYYSYMWSEVMDADAFDAFMEGDGAFDPEIAASLKDNILSKGGSESAEVLYKRFRGKMPNVEPLLRTRGLIA